MSKFLRWIVNIVLIVAIVVACGLLIPPLAGITTVIIDDVDMATNLDRGSVTYGTLKKVEELKVGDDIIMQDSKGAYVYALKAVDASSGQCELEDIKSTDSQTRSETFTKEVSKVIFTMPVIGYVTMAMKSTEGLIIIGLAVIFIIILFILSELWKKDKEEDEEDEEDEEGEEVATAPVDMSAHILEKVSSEIGSEISDVIARDTDQAGTAEAIKDAEIVTDNGVMGDTVPLEEPTKEIIEETDIVKELEEAIVAGGKETKEAVTDKADAAKEETVDRADDVKEAVAEEVKDVKEIVNDEAEDAKEVSGKLTEDNMGAEDLANQLMGVAANAEELEPEEDLEPVEMAMPIHTAEELIQKAKEDGLEPEIQKDEDLGITILDYSKIL